ncbi:MAG: hypothetical protein ACQER9_02565 [Nanobdellota archaeon]
MENYRNISIIDKKELGSIFYKTFTVTRIHLENIASFCKEMLDFIRGNYKYTNLKSIVTRHNLNNLHKHELKKKWKTFLYEYFKNIKFSADNLISDDFKANYTKILNFTDELPELRKNSKKIKLFRNNLENLNKILYNDLSLNYLKRIDDWYAVICNKAIGNIKEISSLDNQQNNFQKIKSYLENKIVKILNIISTQINLSKYELSHNLWNKYIFEIKKNYPHRYKINLKELKKGDILVKVFDKGSIEEENNFRKKALKASKKIHVALYVGVYGWKKKPKIIESHKGKIKVNDFYLENGCYYEVLRSPLNERKISEIIKNIIQVAKKRPLYSKKNAIKLINDNINNSNEEKMKIKDFKSNENLFLCTSLIEASFRKAGISLTPILNPLEVTPADISKSSYLQMIGIFK